MAKSSLDSDKKKLFNDDFWASFNESADRIGFLDKKLAWQELINKMEENNEQWDLFFAKKPVLLFTLLPKFDNPLSIILSKCEDKMLIKMIEEDGKSFAYLLLALPPSETKELLQNGKFTSLLKISFEHAKEQEKKIFSSLILKFQGISDGILRDALQEIPGLKVGLKFLSEEAQKRVIKCNPKYFQHAEKSFQRGLLDWNPEYFKHAAEGVRSKLLKESPKEYLKYAAEYEQEEYLKTIDLKKSDLILYASENVRLKLLKENPAELLKKVTVADQIDFLDAPGGFKFFQFATSFAQKALSKEAPEIWLKYAEDDIQRALSEEAPEVYLKHAMKKVQIDFLGWPSYGNYMGRANLKYAAPDVQFSLSKGKPEIWLDDAIQEVQLAVLFENDGKDLHHASKKSQEAYEDNEYNVEVKKHHLEQVEMWEMLLLAESPQLPED